MKDLSIVFIISLLIFGCNECRKCNNENFDEYELLGCDSISLDYDTSLAEKEESVLTVSSTTYTSSSQSKYANDGHPGTKPDDPLFGYDYYDDADNAYEMERNQIDAYPDDW